MTLRVLHGGALTTVQDQGRHGWRHIGVARAGALDAAQARLANQMVGNAGDAAVLELTVFGPTLAFDAPQRIALCGARVDAVHEGADGHRRAVPHGRPVTLGPGTLRLGSVRDGVRAWCAFAGGLEVPVRLGSRSTDLRGGFGGLDGRALRVGDVLTLGAHAVQAPDAPVDAVAWWVALDHGIPAVAPIRLVAHDAAAHALAERGWRVDPRSDRQGLRLQGHALPAPAGERVSAPVAPGTVQLPPDGQPIVLLADAQTVGGYAALGHVIAADLPRLAQKRPGEPVSFAVVDAAEARKAWERRQAEIARLQWAIARATGAPPR